MINRMYRTLRSLCISEGAASALLRVTLTRPGMLASLSVGLHAQERPDLELSPTWARSLCSGKWALAILPARK